MKAAQIVGPQKIEIVEADRPDIDRAPPGGLLVKAHRTSICGSDMPMFGLNLDASNYPFAPGSPVHECIGEVAESRSEHFNQGDRVLALPRGSGGLAQYFLSNEAVAIQLPDYEHQDRILMAQPLGTVIYACRKLGNLLNQDVVVVGQGSIGLLVTHLLSNLGARRVIATDLLDYRLDVARQMRATHTINAAEEDPVARVHEITEGRMADLVFEVVGHQTETINHCLDLVKRDGTIVAFGVPDQQVYDFHFSMFFRKNVRFISSVGPEAQIDFALAADMIAQGRVDVAPMITHHLSFTEAQKGFELAHQKQDGAIKIVFDFD